MENITWSAVEKKRNFVDDVTTNVSITKQRLTLSKKTADLFDDISKYKSANILAGRNESGDLLKIRIAFREDSNRSYLAVKNYRNKTQGNRTFMFTTFLSKVIDVGIYSAEKHDDNTLDVIIKEGTPSKWENLIIKYERVKRETIRLTGAKAFFNSGALRLMPEHEKYMYTQIFFGSDNNNILKKIRFVFKSEACKNSMKCNFSSRSNVQKQISCSEFKGLGIEGSYPAKKVADDTLEIDLSEKIESVDKKH